MMPISEAAGVLKGRVQGPDVVFSGVSTDTRTVKPGDLFVALRGERFDAHRFTDQARAGGAVAAIVDREGAVNPFQLPVIVVADTRLALGELAGHWRRTLKVRLVALTGSSGKTSVKEMLAAILRAGAKQEGLAPDAVIATRGNLNNDIGMPLMLLEMRSTHRYAVIEMGMNHAGEIRYLAQLADPDVALITNAGHAHIEFLGSREAIARAKGELFDALRPHATAVINADDRFADLWRQLAADRQRVEFGLDHPAAVTATYRTGSRGSELELKTPLGTGTATLRAPGVHNVRNALAAAAAAVVLGVPMTAITEGLSAYCGVEGRLQAQPAHSGATLIDDTYNANPESARAAIEVLAASDGRRVLVLGDMGELGERASALHAELGVFAREAGVDRLLAMGEHSAEAVRTFGAGATHYSEVEPLIAAAAASLAPDVTVLVKGSRFMKMERVVEALSRGATHLAGTAQESA